MCGIVGYIGKKECLPILLNGLRRMEYRGYDSAGVAILNDNISICKQTGKVNDLANVVKDKVLTGNIGIGHTRWATHGEPNFVNSHPHSDSKEEIALIHNGIIENYASIKKSLISEGYTFRSDTDTEVLVQFVRSLYDKIGDLETAFRSALKQVVGAYGIAMISSLEPDKLYIARNGSPLALGIGDNEYIVASDASAIVEYTRNVIYLGDGEMSILTNEGYSIKTIDDVPVIRQIEQVSYDIDAIEKSGFDHFMLKEIFEQPDTVKNAMRGRLLEDNVKLGGLEQIKDKLRDSKRIIVAACGTSWHAALVGEYMIEQLAGIPVEVEYASEFRYREPIIQQDDILIAISQSGETADTLAAVREAKQKGLLH